MSIGNVGEKIRGKKTFVVTSGYTYYFEECFSEALSKRASQ